MRLLLEILVVVGLLLAGWSVPFSERLHLNSEPGLERVESEPTPTPAEAASPLPTPPPTPTPRDNSWMWEKRNLDPIELDR